MFLCPTNYVSKSHNFKETFAKFLLPFVFVLCVPPPLHSIKAWNNSFNWYATVCQCARKWSSAIKLGVASRHYIWTPTKVKAHKLFFYFIWMMSPNMRVYFISHFLWAWLPKWRASALMPIYHMHTSESDACWLACVELPFLFNSQTSTVNCCWRHCVVLDQRIPCFEERVQNVEKCRSTKYI